MSRSSTSHLTRQFAYVVATVQLGAAATGLILGASHFAGVTYRPARDWAQWLPGDPSYWWSGTLAVLALAALVALRFAADRPARYVFALLATYWTWWTVLYALSWPNGSSGPWAPWFALMCVVGNARPVIARTLASG